MMNTYRIGSMYAACGYTEEKHCTDAEAFQSAMDRTDGPDHPWVQKLIDGQWWADWDASAESWVIGSCTSAKQ